jgi:HEPN domain-containing protein
MTGKTDTVALWIQKAENDLKTGSDEFKTDEPATDTICFHAQQCAEKYLKAFLILTGNEIEKTHNISRILKQCMELDSTFNALLDIGISILTAYAVELRYPDDFYMPDSAETRRALSLAIATKTVVLQLMSERGFIPPVRNNLNNP